MDFVYLETERLRLRLVTPEQWQTLYNTRSEEEIRAMLDISREEYLKHKKRCEGGLVSWDRRFAYFQLVLKETGRVIGTAGFHNWFPEHRRAEIGYVIDMDEHKNRGYMTETLAILFPYGFEQLQLCRIEAHVEPSNIPSLRLLQRFGFEQEGLLRKHYYYNGELQDSLLFALLTPMPEIRHQP